MNEQNFLKALTELLDNSKCEDIQVFNTSINQGYTFSSVIVATCLSARHVEAVSQDAVKLAKIELKNPEIQNPTNTDGTKTDGWVAVEIKPINAILHLFTDEVRKKYSIEQLLAQIVS